MSTKAHQSSQYQPSGAWIRPAKRLSIYIRDSFQCLYCGADLRTAAPENVTLDHLVPRSAGGNNEPTNLVTACRACNCSRQDKPWMDFAPGGAVERIQTRRHQPINVELAKAILEDRQAALVAAVEAAR